MGENDVPLAKELGLETDVLSKNTVTCLFYVRNPGPNVHRYVSCDGGGLSLSDTVVPEDTFWSLSFEGSPVYKFGT